MPFFEGVSKHDHEYLSDRDQMIMARSLKMWSNPALHFAVLALDCDCNSAHSAFIHKQNTTVNQKTLNQFSPLSFISKNPNLRTYFRDLWISQSILPVIATKTHKDIVKLDIGSSQRVVKIVHKENKKEMQFILILS